jgi:hypothetical protein
MMVHRILSFRHCLDSVIPIRNSFKGIYFDYNTKGKLVKGKSGKEAKNLNFILRIMRGKPPRKNARKVLTAEKKEPPRENPEEALLLFFEDPKAITAPPS